MSRQRSIHEGDSLAELAQQLLQRKAPLRVAGLRGAARAAVIAQLARAHGPRPLLVVVPTAKDGDALQDDLRATLGEKAGEGRLRAFPRYDTQPYERFSPQPFLVAQRMDVLYRWLASPAPQNGGAARGEAAPIVVAPWTALAARVPTREFVRGKSVHLEVGRIVDRDALIATLVAAGYARMPLVEERGELAVRGGILDLYPPQRPLPVRVELLGDEVESIREFDPASQRSQAALPYVVAPPPRELLVERSLVLERQDALRQLAADQGVSGREVDALVDTLLRGSLPPGAEALAPLLLRGMETVFDFLPPTRRWWWTISAPDARACCATPRRRSRTTSWRARAGGWRRRPKSWRSRRRSSSPRCWRAHRCCSSASTWSRATASPRGASTANPRRSCAARSPRRAAASQALAPLAQRIAAWTQARYRVVLATPSLSHAERLKALLAEYKIDARATADPRAVWRWSSPGRVEVRATPLSEGFELPLEKLAVVTEEEIFGPREKTRRKSAWPAGAAIDALAQLSPGDFLVHAEHGIGIYRGLVDLELRGVAGEFLRIEYAEEARLFVPVHRLNLVSRYAGSDGQVPRIDKLGGVTWERARKGVRRALRDMAKELLAVHAAREVAQGFAFSPRDPTSRSSRRPSPTRRRPISWPPSRTCWPTCRRTSRWTASCAATSATARRRWPCAPPSAPRWTASRWPCWCPPRSCVSSTRRPSASASTATRCGSARSRASNGPAIRARCSRAWRTAPSTS